MATRDEFPKRVTGRFVFDELGEAEPPQLTLTRVDASGGRAEVPIGKDGTFTLDGSFVGQRNVLEVGGPAGTDVRRFHFDDLAAHLAKQGEYVLPQSVWDKFRLRFGSVSGTVESCRPLLLLDALQRSDAVQLHTAGLGAVRNLDLALAKPDLGDILFPRFCRRVCDGTVDVYVRTCCCPFFDPGIIVRNICEIIDCDRLVVGPKIPIPDPIGPVAHLSAVADSLRRSLEGGSGLPGADQILDLFEHHETLLRLDARAQVAYVEAHPELRFLGCKCTLVKVASVPIQEDGTFDAVFVRPYAGPGCTQRVVYVVSQQTPTGPRVIYDGRIGPVTFGLGEEAGLRVSWTARTCDRDDNVGDTGVFLNRIGATSSVNLVRSVEQDGELSYAPLATTDGLVNGGTNVWGGTLALRYSFHQNMKTLGATHYRVRIQRVDDNGNALGAPVDHSTPIAWGLHVGTQIVQTTLGPTSIGSGATQRQNVYTIPYYVDNWDFDANSYHAFVDTTPLVSNGRYLLVIDVFDGNGVRLVPSNSGAAGTGEASKAFVYQRMNPIPNSTTTNLDPVPQKALAGLVMVDNTPSLAAFTGLQQTRNGGVIADVFTGCQFLNGHPDDEVRVRYQAHHAAGWLDDVTINLTEGIGGPTTNVLSNSVDTGAPPATALTDTGHTFGALLGADHKCSFAATMLVTTRHTNGSGALTNLWVSAAGAFALERTGP